MSCYLPEGGKRAEDDLAASFVLREMLAAEACRHLRGRAAVADLLQAAKRSAGASSRDLSRKAVPAPSEVTSRGPRGLSAQREGLIRVVSC